MASVHEHQWALGHGAPKKTNPESPPQLSADEADDMLMVVNFFPAATTPLPRHMGETGL